MHQGTVQERNSPALSSLAVAESQAFETILQRNKLASEEAGTPFELLLARLSSDPALFNQSEAKAIQRLLTLDGRLPLADGQEALWDVEYQLVLALAAEEELRLQRTADTDIRLTTTFGMSRRSFCTSMTSYSASRSDAPI